MPVDEDSEFVRPPEAPVFEPSQEEFMDPMAYITKIRPVAEEAGICKIRPPPNWQPPFAVDIDSFRFTPRIQRLNELEANTRIKLNFLARLAKFWELQGMPLKIPLVDKKYLDLYRLHKAVQDEGGFEVVTREKKWPKIAVCLCYQASKNIGSTLRLHCEKILYPFDVFMAAATTDIKANAASDADGDFGSKTDTATDKNPQESVSVVKKIDYSLNSELKKLQFFGAGPKTALPDTLVGDTDEILVQACSDSKMVTRQVRGKKTSHVAGAVCRACGSGTDDMLVCDVCNSTYHNSCLIHPLSELPRGEWCCPKCVAWECHKPTEVYGFEQAKREYSLQSFGEMADQFKLDYFGMPIHTVPCSVVENEFWRLVNCIEEEVVVEYGADNPSAECGSGFPMEKTRHLFPDDDEYVRSPWNLNNLPILKQCVLHYINAEISGMKVPWCYIGMCFSSFAWHIEDHWNYSINYLHWGEPKTWYGVPSAKAELLEDVMKRNAPELFEQSPDLLHQLTTIMNPNTLMSAGVPIVRTDQQAGEFVVTFPRAYHSGFNQGYNFAEAVNFSTASWLPMGRACIEHYRLLKRQCVFSHDELVCRMASLPAGTLDLTMSVMVYQDMIAMVEDERKLRKQLLDSGTVEAEQEAFELLPDDLRQCNVCKTTCFLSAVTCRCVEGRLVCLHHADRLCQCPASQHRLRYRYTLDELLTYIGRLKHSLQDFEDWARRAKFALDAKDELRLDLGSFKALITEAEERDLPLCPLLEALTLTVTEARKCSIVVHKLFSDKVSTRQRESGDTPYAVKLSVEELEGFYKQIATLPCHISEQSIVSDLLKKIHKFQEDVRQEVGVDLMDLSRLEKLFDEFTTPPDIDVPELTVLKKAVQQSKWLEEVKNSLQPGLLSSIDVNVVRRLIQMGVAIGTHPSCERAMSELQQLLTASDRCEQKALKCLKARPPVKLPKVKVIVDEASIFSVMTPSVTQLTEALKSAQNWTSRVAAMLQDSTHPSLSAVDDLIAQGRDIPVFLDKLAELQQHAAAARTWLQKAAEAFLIDPSHSLTSVLSPHSDVPGFDLSAIPANSTESPSTMELLAMLNLRQHNRLKTEQAGTTYCVCRRVRSGKMVLCQLCLDLFHAECVKYVEPAAPRSVEADTLPDLQQLYFCPKCVRSCRPPLDVLYTLTCSLQNLVITLPEATAAQNLHRRAVCWRDEVQRVLQSDEVRAVQNEHAEISLLSRLARSHSGYIFQRENFEKLYSTLNRLMVEGDLLEVSLPEKLLLRNVLRTCRPADYEQIVFGFPEVLRDFPADARNEPKKRVKRRVTTAAKGSAEKMPRRKRKLSAVKKHAAVNDDSEEICAAETCLRPAGDKVTWVQCDICQLWFHFACIGVDSISEQDDYMCIRCTEKRYASLVTAAQQHNAHPHAADPSDVGTESASSDCSSGDDEYDEHMKEFYAESVDSYIIRSNRKSPASATSGGEPSRTHSDKFIVLE